MIIEYHYNIRALYIDLIAALEKVNVRGYIPGPNPVAMLINSSFEPHINDEINRGAESSMLLKSLVELLSCKI